MMGEELKMGIDKMMNGRPRMAIVDPNMLAVLGLKQILQKRNSHYNSRSLF